MKDWLIYGANGAIGQRIAREAARRGYRPILAGRDNAIMLLADELDLQYRIFDLQHSKVIRDQLADIAVLLNCAGPFSVTAHVMRQACLKCGCHYLDLACATPDVVGSLNCQTEAREQGVVVLPALGFDNVVSEYLLDSLIKPDAEGNREAEAVVEKLSAVQVSVSTITNDSVVMRSALVDVVIESICAKQLAILHHKNSDEGLPVVSLNPELVGIPLLLDLAANQVDIAVFSSIHPYQKRWLTVLRLISALLPKSLRLSVGWWVRNKLRHWHDSFAVEQRSEVWVKVYRQGADTPLQAECELSCPESFTVTSALSAVEYVLADKVMPGAAMPVAALDIERVEALVYDRYKDEPYFLEIDSKTIASSYDDNELI